MIRIDYSTLECQINVTPPLVIFSIFFQLHSPMLDPSPPFIPNIFYSPLPKLTISIQTF